MRPQLNLPSSRQIRRAAKRMPAPTRQRRPADIPMIVKVDYVLSPLESVISQIELRGTLDVDDSGTPIFRAMDGMWYETAPALAGIIELFDQWGIRHNKPVPLTALRQLHARLEYVMPIDAMMLDDVKAILPALRKVAGSLSPKEASDLITGTQIKSAMEEMQGDLG